MHFIIIFLFLITLFIALLPNRYHQKKVIIRKPMAMNLSFEMSSAYSYLNEIRENLSMNPLLANQKLEKASKAHAAYLIKNSKSSHYEVKGSAYFTGEKPSDRAIEAGYISRDVSENLSTSSPTSKNSIDNLFSAIYHRFGFLNPSIDEIGIGIAQNRQQPQKSAFVYLMGKSEVRRLCEKKSFKGAGKYFFNICHNREHRIDATRFKKALNYQKQSNPDIIVYPYPNQKEVPPVFYQETPDPLPYHDVSGFPISIEFNDYFFDRVKLHHFKLYNSQHQEIKNVQRMDKESDPHHHFSSFQYALFPLERLKYNSHYFVEILYEHKNQKKRLQWSFSTTKTSEKLHTITQNISLLKLSSKESHILYFKPLNPFDILKNVEFPSAVHITFIDHNTLKLDFLEKEIDNFEIRTKNKKVSIEVL